MWFCVEILFLTYFNIMKKYFIFAAAAIVAASCAKTPAPVQTPDGPEAPAVEGKVAVQFGTNVVANATTKASGPISGWNKQSLYILGFARTETGKNWGTPFINNVKAYLFFLSTIKNKIINIWHNNNHNSTMIFSSHKSH